MPSLSNLACLFILIIYYENTYAMKTTNYYNTFIEVADDCPVTEAEAPPERKRKTKVRMQYKMLANHPYEFTSDDVIFNIYAERNGITRQEKAGEREKFFSKSRACLRSSSLGKRYGWGIHYDDEGKMALYGLDSDEYNKLSNDPDINHLKAMRSSRR